MDRTPETNPIVIFVRLFWAVVFVLAAWQLSGCGCMDLECRSFCEDEGYSMGGVCVTDETCVCTVCCDTCNERPDPESCWASCERCD